MVICDNLKTYALDVDGDALDSVGEAMCVSATEDPSVVCLITIALPIVPHLSSSCRKVLQCQPPFRIEAQRAVSL